MRSSSVVAFLSLALVASACGDSSEGRPGDAFTVMTHDLGVGADLEAVFAASTADVPALVDTLWAQQQGSSFAARADGIAAGVARYHPHLVGLQSVLQWWEQTPASAAPADALVSDYLELLLAALAARGLAYDPVAVTTTADIELTGASGNDYRLVDREVILARRGMPVSAAEGGTYAAQRTIPIAVPAVVNRRGWALVRATHDSGTVRFLSTRLEPTDRAVQREQARELSGISAGSLPTIVVGNLGSNPQLPSSPAFGILQGTGAPFVDLAGSAGATFPSCCRDPLLSDPNAHLDRRIDWVLGRNEVAVWWGSWVNGNGTPMTGGRWASDHAGVVAGVALFP
jgi:RES domain-containing protein